MQAVCLYGSLPCADSSALTGIIQASVLQMACTGCVLVTGPEQAGKGLKQSGA